MIDWLTGKKTYLVAVVLGLIEFARAAGYIDAETANTLRGFLLAGGLAALRAGVAKLNN